MKISVVAPAHNEQESLPAFLQRTKLSLEKTGLNWEIVIVDDGSTDTTWEILKEAHKNEPKIKAFRLSRNFGHQGALVRAMQEASGDLICTIDADLQDPPELIPQMLEKLKSENLDLIYGQRSKRKGVSPALDFCYKTFYRVLEWMSGTPIPRDTGDFRVAKRKIVEVVLSMKDSHQFLRGAFAWVGFRQAAFLYERDAREGGQSSYNIGSLIELAINGIWGFSMKPLRLAIILALALGGFAALMAFYILWTQLKGSPAPSGWSSLVIVILITGSANLLALGTIAEYIGQILRNTRERPDTVVAERLTN